MMAIVMPFFEASILPTRVPYVPKQHLEFILTSYRALLTIAVLIVVMLFASHPVVAWVVLLARTNAT